MLRKTFLLGLILALSGCAVIQNIGGAIGGGASPKGPNSVNINGTVFRSQLGIGGPGKRDLTINVRPVRVDPRGAQEAGRYRATVYCLRMFGSSETDWIVGPDLPPERLQISAEDTITLRGRCAAR